MDLQKPMVLHCSKHNTDAPSHCETQDLQPEETTHGQTDAAMLEAAATLIPLP